MIGIIALCTLFGLYRGFIQSVLNLAGGLLAFVGSFLLFPDWPMCLAQIRILPASSAPTRIPAACWGDLDLSSRAVSSLGQTGVAAIVEKAALPEPMARCFPPLPWRTTAGR